MENKKEIFTITDPLLVSDITSRCEEAAWLIENGNLTHAKDNFPLECHLITKYMQHSFSDFKILLEDRLLLNK